LSKLRRGLEYGISSTHCFVEVNSGLFNAAMVVLTAVLLHLSAMFCIGTSGLFILVA